MHLALLAVLLGDSEPVRCVQVYNLSRRALLDRAGDPGAVGLTRRMCLCVCVSRARCVADGDVSDAVRGQLPAPASAAGAPGAHRERRQHVHHGRPHLGRLLLRQALAPRPRPRPVQRARLPTVQVRVRSLETLVGRRVPLGPRPRAGGSAAV